MTHSLIRSPQQKSNSDVNCVVLSHCVLTLWPLQSGGHPFGLWKSSNVKEYIDRSLYVVANNLWSCCCCCTVNYVKTKFFTTGYCNFHADMCMFVDLALGISFQSGNMSMPRSYGQYPGPARPPYGTAGFGAFGGVPPYGGYPGFQAPRQPFPDRHPGMPPMMPPRIPTPPVNAPAGIQMHRSHTPSPETVMPIGVPPQAEQAAEGTAQTNSTIQQATQTTPQRKKAGRSSSRRSSEDKAAAQQDSRQEAGHEEKEGHEGNAQQRQQNENRNPRQGELCRSTCFYLLFGVILLYIRDQVSHDNTLHFNGIQYAIYNIRVWRKRNL